MATSQRKLAESLGVSLGQVAKVKKSLGITSKTLSDNDVKRISKACEQTIKLQKDTKEKMTKTSGNFEAQVRHIENQDVSSASDMLQDCKEQYVENQKLIKRLEFEIKEQEICMNGVGNGTLSGLPQFKSLERFQKINIALRNQIVQLEEALGKVVKAKEDDDPFN